MSKPWLALFLLLIRVPAATARPPEAPSGRLAVDEAPALRAEVARLEREKDAPPGDLIETRARLAQAEGPAGAAAAEWRKVVTFRQAQHEQLMRYIRAGKDLTPADLAMARGQLGAARCRLAELERKPGVLVEELPKVIASYYAQLDRYEALRLARAVSEAEAIEAEQQLWKDLRRARLQLDAARRKLGQ